MLRFKTIYDYNTAKVPEKLQHACVRLSAGSVCACLPVQLTLVNAGMLMKNTPF